MEPGDLIEEKRGNKEEKEWRNKYRVVFFGSQAATEVLDDILRECHYYDTLPTDSPAIIALHNLAKVILDKCGIVRDDITVNTLVHMFNLSAVERMDN